MTSASLFFLEASAGRCGLARSIGDEATYALIIRRELDRVVLLAGVEFENLAQHAGRHRRNRIDAQHWRSRRADHFIGDADETFIAAAPEEQADHGKLAEHVVEP